MSNSICFIITVLYNDVLIKCALKVNEDDLKGDAAKYPMEPENREQLHALLPDHVRSCGPIVEVDSNSLFEIVLLA